MGKAIDENIRITAQQIQADGTVVNESNLDVAAPYNQNAFMLELPITATINGLHTIHIFIDSEEASAEICEANNTLSFDMIVETGTPLYAPAINNINAEVYQVNTYPNPCSKATAITFELPKTAMVEWTVFNALGQPIKKVLPKQKLVKGTHTIPLTTQQLPNGMYWSQLKINNDLVQQRFMVQH